MFKRVTLLLAGLAAAAALAAVLPGGEPPAARRPAPPASGSEAMAARLAALRAQADPRENRFLSRGRARIHRETLERTRDVATQVPIRLQLAEQLINAGEPEQALAELEPLATLWDGIRAFVRPGTERHARELKALAWMRVGEQSNCGAHHGAESCLLPIQGSGIHKNQVGSRQAMAELLGILDNEPENLGARWLLNIAAMTVGEWPEQVPARFRIAPEVFASEADIGRFREVAIDSGLAVRGLAGGAITEDLDGDLDLDVMFSHMGLGDPLHYFRNEGDGRFVERGAESGLAGLTGGLNIVQADYDNDGDVDVLVLRGAWMGREGIYPSSLLNNRGDGHFEDVTERAGLLRFHPTQVGAWADYDGDGWLDLFVGNESTPDDPHPSELWHNNRDGTFTDVLAGMTGADLGFVKGAAWGDFNNDGRPDLYVSLFGRNRLLRNDGGTFTDVAAAAGVTEPKESFPTWWLDYDNDGWLDILVGGYYTNGVKDVAAMYLELPGEARMPRLYRNRGDGTFEDVTRRVRLDRVALPMGANFGDLDNDGWLDCYFGTGEPGLAVLMPNRMFRNDAGRAFQDVTTSGGFGHLQKGHGVAFADMDGDGDQDVVEQMGGAFEGDTAFSVLFENPGHGNRWIALRLEGRRANRSAIGARIRVRLRGAEGRRDLHLMAGSGGSFGGSSLQQEIGLGRAEAIEGIEVTWPGSGLRQELGPLAMDRYYQVVEGAPPVGIEVPAFKLGGVRR